MISNKKIYSIVFFVLISCFSVILFQKAYYKYKYFKVIESQRNNLLEKQKISNKKIDSLISHNLYLLKKFENESDKIDSKRKRNEKAIDNRNVSDAELDGFLSRFGE